jgi:hypothetical protein
VSTFLDSRQAAERAADAPRQPDTDLDDFARLLRMERHLVRGADRGRLPRLEVMNAAFVQAGLIDDPRLFRLSELGAVVNGV